MSLAYAGTLTCLGRVYYRRTPKHEVEQIIMDLYRPIIKEYGSGTLIEKAYNECTLRAVTFASGKNH